MEATRDIGDIVKEITGWKIRVVRTDDISTTTTTTTTTTTMRRSGLHVRRRGKLEKGRFGRARGCPGVGTTIQ
jgi:hypothetical protein